MAKLIVAFRNLTNWPNKRDFKRMIGYVLHWYGRVESVVDAFSSLDSK